MAAVMHPVAHTPSLSTARIWTGRLGNALAVLLLALDGTTKVLRVPAVLEASARLGFSPGATVGLGALLLACLAAYLAPRTAPLGAVLLTGYLGGAVATHARLGSPAFSLAFPVALGALLWGGLALRDARVRAALRRP